MTTWEIIKYILLYIVMGAGVFALVGLGIFMVNLAKAVKSAKTILDDNKPAIDHSMSVLPEVMENVSDITFSVGHRFCRGMHPFRYLTVKKYHEQGQYDTGN